MSLKCETYMHIRHAIRLLKVTHNAIFDVKLPSGLIAPHVFIGDELHYDMEVNESSFPVVCAILLILVDHAFQTRSSLDP